MAGQTALGNCIAPAQLTSLQAGGASRRPPECCTYDASCSRPTLFPSLLLTSCNRSYSAHSGRKERGSAGDGLWAVAAGRGGGQLAVLSSAGISDQNERLNDAAKAGDLRTVNEILGVSELSIDLPSSSRAGWTALHLASFYDHLPIVESLLKAGATLDVRTNSGNTPLQLASLKGNIDVARVLLESGADYYAESVDKGTALEYAKEWGGDDMVDFLLLWAADSMLKL